VFGFFPTAQLRSPALAPWRAQGEIEGTGVLEVALGVDVARLPRSCLPHAGPLHAPANGEQVRPTACGTHPAGNGGALTIRLASLISSRAGPASSPGASPGRPTPRPCRGPNGSKRPSGDKKAAAGHERKRKSKVQSSPRRHAGGCANRFWRGEGAAAAESSACDSAAAAPAPPKAELRYLL
jgi:hypothetical protein